jgi:hypothetical protein
MTSKRGSGKGRIPEFKSIAEEAEFWDTHDTTDFEDEFKPVRVRVSKNLTEPVTFRLDADTLAELRERAKKMGIGPTTLARMWVLERLRTEREHASTS